MSPGNADLIRPIYDEWGKGNWRPSFDVYHPRMEWGWSDEFPDIAGVFADTRVPNPRLLTWLREWDHWRVVPGEFVEIGDYVVVLACYIGRGKGSGVEIRQEGAHVFKLRDGKVVRLEIFADRAKALESVAGDQAATAASSPSKPSTS
jgi:uncharacterized protein